MSLYQHLNCKDTAIEILKKFYVPEKDAYSLKIMWWDTGVCHAPRRMNIVQRIKITRFDLRNNWKLYTKEI